jgi:hypothetical protein
MVIIGVIGVLNRNDDERLQLWPFPQEVAPGMDRAKMWTEYRTRMLSDAGVCIVLSGNKQDPSTGSIVAANGVHEEVSIARGQGKVIIPVGATGHVAEEVWKQAQAKPSDFYGPLDFSKQLAVIGDARQQPAQIVEAIIEMLKQLESKGP